jgi:hypothetical protein
MLIVRGAANWSTAFAATWYGLFGAAVALAIAAAVVAALSRDLAVKPRLAMVVMSLPALLAVPLMLCALVTAASLAD